MSWRTVPSCAATVAALLVLPASAWSAVPRTGNTFSPRTGAELLEAADAITAEGTTAGFKGIVRLTSGTDYSVTRTVEFRSVTQPTISVPTGGRATISNSGTPGYSLLRLASQQLSDGGIRNVDFTLRGSSTTAFVAVDLQRGSLVRDSAITVPTSTTKATAVRLSPALGPTVATPPSATLQGVTVSSGAAEAPAVVATNGARVLDAVISGGASPVEIVGDASGADLGSVVVDASDIRTVGTGASVPVVRVRGGGNNLRAVLWSSFVNGTASPGAGQLIDVTGPTATSGAVSLDLGQLTLRGVSSSIATRVRAGLGTTPLNVRSRGVLTLGSAIAVDCAGSSGAVTNVGVTSFYRSSGANNASSNCDLSETGRRTGTLAWRDEAGGELRPVWNSPLVDAVSDADIPVPAGEHDQSGKPRFSLLGTGTPGDIGALEYQLTPPENVSSSYLPMGNRGMTALIGEATDTDEFEEPKLIFRWTWMDDTLIGDGPVVLHRFPSAASQQVRLTVIDVTGKTVRRTMTVQPVFRLDQPATDENDPDDPQEPIPGDGGGPQIPGIIPQTPVIPVIPIPVVPSGTNNTPVRPGVDPSIITDYPPILKKVTAKSRRVFTNRLDKPAYASARKGEAEFVIETFRKSEMSLEVFTVLEGQGLTTGLPVASVTLKSFTGRKTLRAGAKFGKRKLKPGLYQFIVTASPRPGAVPERAPFFVRVLRAKK